jgi:glycerol-3-phosphate dehydrogenase
MSNDPPLVVILGGGINGAAIARELTLQGFSIALVDTADLAFGATSYSSRLIHGGLRYLEYGEFDLVRESLAERRRLLDLAPQFVQPLELFIPVPNRWGGMLQSVARFCRLERWEQKLPRQARGLWLVRIGLWLYDRLARDPALPRHSAQAVNASHVPPVDAHRYRWLCSYFDAQIRYPERFVVALLEDARRAAADQGNSLSIWTYHAARLDGATVQIVSPSISALVATLHPAAIIKATGAWVDQTLQRLPVKERRLMAGTKGSHLISSNEPLRTALAGRGIYAEADDGRPVFILPFGDATLIGTTDLPFDGDPANAVATNEEIDYLLETVNEILPDVQLARSDVALHYSGVRPLPYVSAQKTGAITRRHWLQEHPDTPVPLYSVIGGKLTTCRSLAEQTATTLCQRLGRPQTATSRERFIPGGENYPTNSNELATTIAQLARQFHLPPAAVCALWGLLGTRVETVLAALGYSAEPMELVPDSDLPQAFVRWVIDHEYVERLGDLVERRLMMLYDPRLSRRGLQALAHLLCQAGKLSADQIDDEVRLQVLRLQEHFGKYVSDV